MKTVFFDIDGTIIDVIRGLQHPTALTRYCFEQLKKNGHRPVIASGRMKSMLSEDILSLEPSGYLLCNGAVFELEGLQLEAIKVKGHTPGAICLLDRKHRLLYVGDAVLRHVSILHVGGQSVSDFIEGMEKLKARSSEFDFIVAAHGHRQHGFRPLETAYIQKMIDVARAIDVEKSTERHEADGDGYEYYLNGGKYADYDSVSIAYRLDCLK